MLDLTRIESEPVKRNKRGQAWKQRQQDRVGDAARDEEEVLLRDFAPGTPENVLPAVRRNLARMIRLASGRGTVKLTFRISAGRMLTEMTGGEQKACS